MENLKILEEKENPLFNRKEIRISIEAEITPNREEVKKLISKKFSAQTENIQIKKISGKFGSKTFIVNCFIYDSEEQKENIEPKSKKQTETKPIEEAKQENKSEEKKE